MELVADGADLVKLSVFDVAFFFFHLLLLVVGVLLTVEINESLERAVHLEDAFGDQAQLLAQLCVLVAAFTHEVHEDFDFGGALQ